MTPPPFAYPHSDSAPTMTLFIEQCLNGLQFGLLLFLLAAGLTLVLTPDIAQERLPFQ